MENNIQIFENPEFGNIRVIEQNGEPWFVGKDVAVMLGYSNTRDALNKHVDEEDKGVAKCDTLSGAQDMTIINESGLYSLVLGSKLPEAKRFKKWVTSEVLPTIRRHGMYATDELLDNPDLLIQVATALKEEREKNRLLKEENALMAPKADYFDALVDKNLLTNFRDAAKEIGCGQKELVDFCIGAGYVYRDGNGKLKPYSKYTGTNGYFALKDFTNGSYAGVQTYFTPKGKETMRLLIQGRLI